MNAGKVEAIWTKRARRGPMDAVSSAELTAGSGIEGNADRGGTRQVTVISKESWEAVTEELGASVPPTARRANLMISGVDLEASRGHTLRVGSTTIEIRGETRPCERMDEAFQGLRAALGPKWRGGVYGVVVEGGTIAIGDAVTLSEGATEG